MYGLAAREEQDENSERFMNIARGITNTCHESYIRSDTKVGWGQRLYSMDRSSRSMVHKGAIAMDI